MNTVDEKTFVIHPEEVVEITIRKRLGPFLAAVSELTGATWARKPEPIGMVAAGSFIAPHQVGTRVSMVLVVPESPSFDVNDPYEIKIQGATGEVSRSLVPSPVGVQTRTFAFEVQDPDPGLTWCPKHKVVVRGRCPKC